MDGFLGQVVNLAVQLGFTQEVPILSTIILVGLDMMREYSQEGEVAAVGHDVFEDV